jgi:transcriptional regulator with XRE-family HTH domain
MPPETSTAAPRAAAPLATKLQWLFANVPSPTGDPYSYAEAERAIKVAGGTTSASYISYLTKGTRPNPTVQPVKELAGLFGVPVGYLAGDSDESVAHLRALLAGRDAGVATPAPEASLSMKLSWLFGNVHPPARGPYSYAEAARLIKAQSHVDIAESYVGYLVKGTRDNPELKHLHGLAALFGVPVGYLAGDDPTAPGPAAIADQLSLLAALRDAGVRAVALRSVGLSDKALESVLAILDHIRDVEGLPTEPTGENGSP